MQGLQFTKALALTELKIKLLEDRLRLGHIARYGKRSEKLKREKNRPRGLG